MIDDETVNMVVRYLLSRIEEKDQEIGRFLVHDEFEEYDNQIVIWAIRTNIREIKETTVTNIPDLPAGIQVKVTYANPSFFEKVLSGYKDVPYWQVATVKRLLSNSEIIFDPKDTIARWIERSKNIRWDESLITLKRETTKQLLSRVENRLNEDMLADAFMWLLKSAEEALCVPLMLHNAFDIGTPRLLLDSLRLVEPELYEFYLELLQVKKMTPDKVEKARKQLETLGDHLYQKFTRTDREMWILAAFVSINESEKRLNQSFIVKSTKDKRRLFETAIGELWQAYFLIAQSPKLDVKLDPWVVASFWEFFGGDEITEEWILNKVKEIKAIVI